MNCQCCHSNRLLDVSAKASDCVSLRLGEYEHHGYMPNILNLGHGDYVEFTVCLDCGQVQGEYAPAERTHATRCPQVRISRAHSMAQIPHPAHWHPGGGDGGGIKTAFAQRHNSLDRPAQVFWCGNSREGSPRQSGIDDTDELEPAPWSPASCSSAARPGPLSAADRQPGHINGR